MPVEVGEITEVERVDATVAGFALTDELLGPAEPGGGLHLGEPGGPAGLPEARPQTPIARIVERGHGLDRLRAGRVHEIGVSSLEARPHRGELLMSLPSLSAVGPVLLAVLAELGRPARPSLVYPLVTARFPEIEPADLTAVMKNGRTSKWENRIQFARWDLVKAGLVDRGVPGLWQLTPAGKALAQRGNITPADLAPLAPTPDSAQEEDASPEEPVAPHAPSPTDAAALIVELEAAATDSRDASRLEDAVAKALRFLGFDVEQIGGPGHTDVVISAPTGARRYSVVVDAKATAQGQVPNAQIDWLAIHQHQLDERADHACVVGPGFVGGQLPKLAREFKVALLTTADLAELVRLHAETPLTLTELRPAFTTDPAAVPGLQTIRTAVRTRRRLYALIPRLLAHIDSFARAQPDLVLAKPDTLLVATLAEHNPQLAGVTLDEIKSALTLLEMLGVISPADGGYVPETSPIGAHQLLMALGAVAKASVAGGGEPP